MLQKEIADMRNFKDFLLLYNQISEVCFRRCANTFLSRDINAEEDRCLKNCVEKHIHTNHKVMQVYVEIQPVLIRKRMEENENMQKMLEAQVAEQQKTEESSSESSQV